MSLSTVIARFLEDTLDQESGSVAEELSVPATADLFGVSNSAIYHAIKVGKLAAAPVLTADGSVAGYRIPLHAAFGVWGHRLLNTKKVAADA